LSVSFNAPHSQDGAPNPYIYPPSAEGLYEGVTMPEPVNAEPEFFDALPEFIRDSESRRRWTEKFTPPDVYQRNIRNLFRMISGIDNAMGRIFAELDALGMADNTVVIFMSDNGMFYGDRGLADCWLLHEQSIRVPLIVCDPRGGQSQRGAVSDQVALNIDVAPTILDLAGLDVPQQMQGRSLLPMLRGDDVAWRTETFLEHLFHPPESLVIPKSEGIRTERWKYIRYFEQSPPYEELYDLVDDPNERMNLAGHPGHAAALDELRRRCDEFAADLALSN
jgi:arylsulfatase A-like enzyme